MNCAPLSCFSVSINWSSSISCTRELWKIRLQKTKWKEKTEKSSEALRPKKNQNSETQKSPEKEFKTITNTSNPRFRDWVKFSETHVSRGTILYRLYPFVAIVAFPCRLLALNLPVSYFSSQCLTCDKHGPAILSWLFSVKLYHLCYLDDCPVFESPGVQT